MFVECLVSLIASVLLFINAYETKNKETRSTNIWTGMLLIIMVAYKVLLYCKGSKL